MQLDPKSAAVEFQTGHCLYAFALAGYTAEDPAVRKSVEYLLKRQQPFGGWFDPLQSYENFRTPFRETQFAVMALSEIYPESPSISSSISSSSSVVRTPPRIGDPLSLLNHLDIMG